MEDILKTITPNDWVSSDDIIKVLGVGGGGCNAVNYMYKQGISGCSFAVCNTDSQALRNCSVPVQIQMGRGLGAGTNPIKGRNSALESQDQIEKLVLTPNTKMLFITAGMGGGTGTGAAPVIAKMAHDKDVLVVAVVTLPFVNEGNGALTRAIDGVHELEKNVDSLLIINNEKLYTYYGDLLLQDAFPKTDEVLAIAVRGIVEIITRPGYINVDFMDVRTLMKDSGMALMGCGEGSGENRIEQAVKSAFESPLLNDFNLKSARKVLVNTTVPRNEKGLTVSEHNLLNAKIDEYTGGNNNFKRGLIYDDSPEIGDTIRITSIVTGLSFSDVIGSTRDIGNYIMVPENFVYDGIAHSRGDEIVLMDDFGSQQIGFNTKNNTRTFHFMNDDQPILITEPGDNIAELEYIPAIRRANNDKS